MSTIEQMQTRLAAYQAAELKILESQEYQIGQGGSQRRNRRADLEQVRAAIKELEDDIAKAQAKATRGARRIYHIGPRC